MSLWGGLLAAIQGLPILSDRTFDWIANNGIGVVFAVILLGLFEEVIRRLFSHLLTRIEFAIGYFTKTLNVMSDRQVQAIRDAEISRVESNTMLTAALRELAAQSAKSTEGLSMLMMFVAHTNEQVVAHREKVEPTIAGSNPGDEGTVTTGVLKPVNLQEDTRE